MVAVISNGTAVLGLGNLGALASKPVMEGKAVLFKRFADVNSIDLELDTEDVDEFVNACGDLGPSLRRHQPRGHQGARLLHHRKRLRERWTFPVFHDDQHGTAMIMRRRPDQRAAPDRPKIKDTKLVCNGAGAAASPASN
jgi:malate dehydrogenase (oxaloacetate-decarboxylating)(NADP+)